MRIKVNLPEIKDYMKDKRIPLQKMYTLFSKFNSNWIGEVVYYQRADYGKNKHLALPILAFRTRKQGNAVWVISGIHGEEPAGPNAIAKNIRFLNRLSKKIPLVIIPLCNPNGYWRNWRYPNRKFMSKNGGPEISVGDSSHLLVNLKNKKKPREEKPSSKVSAALSSYILRNSKKYKPFLVLDLHEDNNARKNYVYSQGRLGGNDPIAKGIINLIRKKGFKSYNESKTIFNQKIINGIVSDVEDSSLDELLSSKEIIRNNKIVRGPYARSVIVVETNTVGTKLKQRIKVHKLILKNIKQFFKISENIYDFPISEPSEKEREIV